MREHSRDRGRLEDILKHVQNIGKNSQRYIVRGICKRHSHILFRHEKRRSYRRGSKHVDTPLPE